MGFAKILARGAILGKKTAFGKTPELRKFGMWDCREKRSGNVG